MSEVIRCGATPHPGRQRHGEMLRIVYLGLTSDKTDHGFFVSSMAEPRRSINHYKIMGNTWLRLWGRVMVGGLAEI